MSSKLTYVWFGFAMIMCVVYLITAGITLGCAFKGKWGCSGSAGAGALLTGCVAAAVIGFSLYAKKNA